MMASSEDLKINSQLLRKTMTEAERRLWQEIRLRQVDGLKFRRQFSIGRYIVDFACPERKLIIELDGGQHAEQESYDSDRTKWLESQGYRVMRFWNNEVLTNLEGVKESIYNAISGGEEPPTSVLPHKGGGNSQGPSPLVGEGVDGGGNAKGFPPPQSSPTRGEEKIENV
jgi:very-short-patch-repair endonuclease